MGSQQLQCFTIGFTTTKRQLGAILTEVGIPSDVARGVLPLPPSEPADVPFLGHIGEVDGWFSTNEENRRLGGSPQIYVHLSDCGRTSATVVLRYVGLHHDPETLSRHLTRTFPELEIVEHGITDDGKETWAKRLHGGHTLDFISGYAKLHPVGPGDDPDEIGVEAAMEHFYRHLQAVYEFERAQERLAPRAPNELDKLWQNWSKRSKGDTDGNHESPTPDTR